MAAKKPENTRSITVRGHELTVDTDYAESYAAFSILRKINNHDVNAFDKLDMTYELIERATGCDEAQIVEMAGGETVPAQDVMQFTVEILAAIDAKN